jgi:hypothetical protein
MISIKTTNLDSTLDWADPRAIEKRIAKQNDYWKQKRSRIAALNHLPNGTSESQDTLTSMGQYFGGISIDHLDEN